MPKLKITERGWEGYTGFLGMVNFVDGVSVEPIHPRHADGLAASIAMVEVDDEGNEIGHYGIQSRLFTESAIPAEVTVPLSTASAEVIAAANAKSGVDSQAVTGYTVADLEKIVEKDGINGLRVVAGPLGIRGRAIPDLIEAIMKRQAEMRGVGQMKKAETYDSDVVIVTGDEGKKAIPAIQAAQQSTDAKKVVQAEPAAEKVSE